MLFSLFITLCFARCNARLQTVFDRSQSPQRLSTRKETSREVQSSIGPSPSPIAPDFLQSLLSALQAGFSLCWTKICHQFVTQVTPAIFIWARDAFQLESPADNLRFLKAALIGYRAFRCDLELFCWKPDVLAELSNPPPSRS